MRCISRDQYDYLVAIGRQDDGAITIAEEKLPSNGELYRRGLYVGNLISSTTFEVGSLRLTQAGKDALMCYRILSTLTEIT
jgi:hypothetical protein